MDRYAIVMAAGKGSRMKSLDEFHSKVSYPILGRALVKYVIEAVKPLNPKEIVTIVGFGGEKTKKIVQDDSKVVWQTTLDGTGHAVLQTKEILQNRKGATIVLCGDTPLITTETLQNLFKKFEKDGDSATILTTVMEKPAGYGRIVREEKSKKILAIKEDKDCNELEKYIEEVNTGIYVFDNELLFKYLNQITPNNAQHEYYLTDVISLMVNDNKQVGAYILEDAEEVFGINDRVQLSYAAKVIRKRVNKKLMLSGVSMEDPDTTYISPDVEIGQDTVILPFTTITGKSKIGHSNLIGPNCYIQNSIIGNNNHVIASYLFDTTIGDNNEVGPFTKTRANTIIGNNCRVGNFVELKNAIFDNGVKCAHLSYIGDSNVGEATNIGCMSVTANYDGVNKSHTDIGKHCFVGSGTILVSPIKMDDQSFSAAGSVITKDICYDELAITRPEQKNIAGGYTKIRNKALSKKEKK